MSILRLSASCAAAISGCMLISSCGLLPPSTKGRQVENDDEVANVYVSAYPAVPWKSISEKLEPKHNLSTLEARTMAAIATQSQLNQFLSTFSAGLALGLPTKVTTGTSSTAADGTTSTTSSRTSSSGAVPASSGASQVPLSDSNLATDLTKAVPSLGIDAATQLTAGTAVYQLAQILDNQISKSLQLKDYQAHLVTFQVNVQPFSRDLEYDAYLNLSLMPASWTKAINSSTQLFADPSALPPIIVYPLVITDAMESASVGRSIETIRQAALSLAGAVGNIGASGFLGGGAAKAESAIGSDRNSLVTVGRVSDSTLRIRVGANLQGSTKHALVTQTHNISVVVFTKAGENEEQFLDRLAVVARSEFVNARTGEKLEWGADRRRDALRIQVEKAVATYGFEFNKEGCSDSDGEVLEVLRAADRGDFARFSTCLSKKQKQKGAEKAPVIAEASASKPETLFSLAGGTLKTPAKVEAQKAPMKVGGSSKDEEKPFELRMDANLLSVSNEMNIRRLFAKLMEIQVDTRYSKLMVQLSPFEERKTAEAPPSQIVMLEDDGDTATAVLRRAKHLRIDELQLKLKVGGSASDFLMPLSTEVDEKGETLTVSFPSISGNGLLPDAPASPVGKPGAGAPKNEPPPLQLILGPEPKKEHSLAQETAYAVKLKVPDKKPKGSPVSATSSHLVADSTGVAKVSITVGKWDADKNGSLWLRVKGADIRATEPAVPYSAKQGGIPLSALSVVTLTLANVTPGQVVQFQSVAGDAGESLSPAISLPVIPQLTASK